MFEQRENSYLSRIIIHTITITVFKYRNKIGKTVVKAIPYTVNVNVKIMKVDIISFSVFIDSARILSLFRTCCNGLEGTGIVDLSSLFRYSVQVLSK
jgi:hypothetical protein